MIRGWQLAAEWLWSGGGGGVAQGATYMRVVGRTIFSGGSRPAPASCTYFPLQSLSRFINVSF